MTGTSADALDGCIVSFDRSFKLVGSLSTELGESYKEKYEQSIKKGYKTIKESNDLKEIEDKLNEKTVELINKLLKKTSIKSSDISSIAFSGQTVFHTVGKSYQIGNPQKISNDLDINVVSDFRNYDISMGGMGAPLIPEFHRYIYSEKDKRKLIINIGGIANGTYLEGDIISLASDIGPGNCLIDHASKKLFNTGYDNCGNESSKGNIEINLLRELMNESSKMVYPRSDDKSDYYALLNRERMKITPNNLLRTLTEFTAEKVKEFYLFCNNPDEVILHGGGTKNDFLMNLINKKINVAIRTTDSEISSKYVEAAGFAYLAYLDKGKKFNSRR